MAEKVDMKDLLRKGVIWRLSSVLNGNVLGYCTGFSIGIEAVATCHHLLSPLTQSVRGRRLVLGEDGEFKSGSEFLYNLEIQHGSVGRDMVKLKFYKREDDKFEDFLRLSADETLSKGDELFVIGHENNTLGNISTVINQYPCVQFDSFTLEPMEKPKRIRGVEQGRSHFLAADLKHDCWKFLDPKLALVLCKPIGRNPGRSGGPLLKPNGEVIGVHIGGGANILQLYGHVSFLKALIYEAEQMATDYDTDDIPASSFSIHMADKQLREVTKFSFDKIIDLPSFTHHNAQLDLPLSEFKRGSKFDLKLILLNKLNTMDNFLPHLKNQFRFFLLFNSYWDVMHEYTDAFNREGHKREKESYIVHCLNHIFKAQGLEERNTFKLENKERIYGEINVRDRGYTRTKVLILLPFRRMALQLFEKLIQISSSKLKMRREQVTRISKEYDVADSDENNKFTIGFAITGASMKLVDDLNRSDIIIASPAGLANKIAEEPVADYLSSIEILIVDHADIIQMQNWDDVKKVVAKLNGHPSKSYRVDVERIRNWYTKGISKFYRQSIILTSSITQDVTALFEEDCFNYQGRMKLLKKIHRPPA